MKILKGFFFIKCILIILVIFSFHIVKSYSQTRYFKSVDALEFQQSPCWAKIGYNPEVPRDILREEYKYCEEQRNKDSLYSTLKIVGIISGLLLLGYIIFYISNSNRREWQKYSDRYDTEENLKLIIRRFFIPDNISFLLYNENQNAYTGKVATPTRSFKKYLLDDSFEKPNLPDWFYFGYPDVTVWLNKSKSDILTRWNTSQITGNSFEILREGVNSFQLKHEKIETKA